MAHDSSVRRKTGAIGRRAIPVNSITRASARRDSDGRYRIYRPEWIGRHFSFVCAGAILERTAPPDEAWPRRSSNRTFAEKQAHGPHRDDGLFCSVSHIREFL